MAEDEPRIASKAAYLAALINAEGSERVVDLASRSRHDVVRASAAAALGSLTEAGAAPIAERLLVDPDAGIRARAVKSVGSLGGDVQRSLRKVADEDEDAGVRELAAGTRLRLTVGCAGWSQRGRQHPRELDDGGDLVGGARTVSVELVAGPMQPDGRDPGLERPAHVAG